MTLAVHPRYLRSTDDLTGKPITIGALWKGNTGYIFRKDISSDCIVDSPRGLSIRKAEFEKLDGERVKLIWVVVDKKWLYVASMETFKTHCQEIDKGTQPHKLLEMKWWRGPFEWRGH